LEYYFPSAEQKLTELLKPAHYRSYNSNIFFKRVVKGEEINTSANLLEGKVEVQNVQYARD
jgi:hypothetical protein